MKTSLSFNNNNSSSINNNNIILCIDIIIIIIDIIIVNAVINFHCVTSSEELFPCSVQILVRFRLECIFPSPD